MSLLSSHNSDAPREEIPAAVGCPAATQRDGFIRRGALAAAPAL